MENLYKDALRRDRALSAHSSKNFTIPWSYKEFDQAVSSDSDSDNESVEPTVTEKTRVLDQLYQFGEKALEASDSLKVEGGELVKKLEPLKAQSAIKAHHYKLKDLSEIENDLNELGLNPKEIEAKTAKLSKLSNIKVFFVTDENYLSENPEFNDLNDLRTYFSSEVSDLLARMIAAMKLGQNDYAISSMTINDTEINDILFSEIYSLKPSLIMTFGAKAAQFFLQQSQRLKDIHGSFYDINLCSQDKEFQAKLMPIFSPKLLQTAPNMKKTAWSDMQEAMKYLNL